LRLPEIIPHPWITPLSQEKETTILSVVPELEWCALIREIHTFWDQLSVHEKGSTFGQHIGFWKKLIAEAEKIAKENWFNKIAVIAWVWVRAYYEKRGYKLVWEYMIKNI